MKAVRPSCARLALAGAALAGATLVLAACTSGSGIAGSSVSSSSAASSGASRPAAAAPRVFLAPGQDVRGTAWYEPTCASGCALSGDSTAILDKMTWSSWSPARAVGTGVYELDACNPSCAAGPVYAVPAVVTLSQPVKVCSASGARWYWSRASFGFPDGLPRALRGARAPQNPWLFAILVSAARQSCAS